MSQARVFTVVDEDDGIRLDRWFSRNLPEAGFAQISRWARTGQIRLDGRRATPGDRILAGQVIRVPPPGAAVLPKKERPQRPTLTEEECDFVRSLVLHEDGAAFVLGKPPGLATQGGTRTHVHLDRLLDGLVGPDEPRPKLVHRLDKDTSGLLLVARTPRAAAFFSRAFASRSARKLYWAILVGVPDRDEGLIDLPLAKQPGSGGEKMHVDPEHGLPSRTRWRVIDRAGGRAALVALHPLTGRTHQLRAHMAAIGHPVLGDGKYGGTEAFLTGAISRKLHLHARRLKIDHPDKGALDLRAEPPPHFRDTLAALGFEPDEEADSLAAPDTPARAPRVRSAAAPRRGERRARATTRPGGKAKRR